MKVFKKKTTIEPEFYAKQFSNIFYLRAQIKFCPFYTFLYGLYVRSDINGLHVTPSGVVNFDETGQEKGRPYLWVY